MQFDVNITGLHTVMHDDSIWTGFNLILSYVYGSFDSNHVQLTHNAVIFLSLVVKRKPYIASRRAIKPRRRVCTGMFRQVRLDPDQSAAIGHQMHDNRQSKPA